MLGYFCFLAAIMGVRSASAPVFTPCKAGDNACAQASAQVAILAFGRGVPELGVKPLDPMHLEVIRTDPAGLKLELRNTTLTGLRNCSVESLDEDLKMYRMTVVLRCTVDLVGDYTLNRRFIVLPVQGEGPYHIKIREIVVKTEIYWLLGQGEDDNQHWSVERYWYDYSYHTQGGAEFTFHNLFNGNKTLAEPVEQYLNNHWREVMQEIAPPIVLAIVNGVVGAVAAFYKAVSVDELSHFTFPLRFTLFKMQ